MIDAVVLYGLWKLMTALCDKKGQSSGIWCTSMVGLYFIGAMCGFLVARSALEPGRNVVATMIGYIYLGAFSGVTVAFMLVLAISTLQDILSGGRRNYQVGDDIDPELLLRRKVKKPRSRRPRPVSSPFDEPNDRDEAESDIRRARPLPSSPARHRREHDRDDDEDEDEHGDSSGNRLLIVALALGIPVLLAGCIGMVLLILYVSLDRGTSSGSVAQESHSPSPSPIPRRSSPEPRGPLYTIDPIAGKFQTKTVDVDSPIGNVAVGGDGRYLILHQPAKGWAAVFDVPAGKVVSELVLPAGDVDVCAGMTHAFVVARDAGRVQCYELSTGKPDNIINLPKAVAQDDILAAEMGSASEGPLFLSVRQGGTTLILDLTIEAAREGKWNHWSAARHTPGPANLRAAPDGSVLAAWGGGGWAGLEVMSLDRGKQTGVKELPFTQGAFALPSADGTRVYTPWGIESTRGAATLKLDKLADAYLVPAHEPGCFVALYKDSQAQPGSDSIYGQLVIFQDNGQPLLTLEDGDWKTKCDLIPEKRVHYYPSSRLLVTIADNKRIVLRRFE
jgi:hypothetical protein